MCVISSLNSDKMQMLNLENRSCIIIVSSFVGVVLFFTLCISSYFIFFFVSFSQIMHKLSFPNGLTQVVDNVLVGLCVYCELPKEVQSSF